MPGHSRAKAKTKSKSRAAQLRTPVLNASVDAYVDQIENATGWDGIVRILCDVFELPDLTTRSGLKKVHAKFDFFVQRIDQAYKDHSRRDKVLGILSQLIPLLDSSICRYVAIRALTTMTHHGGKTVRSQIAKGTASILIRLIEEHTDDPIITELAIATMTHSIGAIVDPGDKKEPDKKDLKTMNIPTVLRVFTTAMRIPTATYYLFDHATSFLANCTLHCSKDCVAYPPAMKALVANLRNTDIIQRCVALGGLIRLHQPGAEDDQRQLDPMKLMAAAQRGFPDHLAEIIMGYGFDRSDTILTLKLSGEYQRAMMKCAQDHDLRALGLVLVRLILQTEFSISEGFFQAEKPRTGELEVIDVGLPFRMWTDSLPHCASALRATGDPKDRDAADILQLKFFVIRQRIQEAVELATRALERSPDVAYFCYIVTLSADRKQGLQFAKKGMKCKSITPFVRFQMMQRAVVHAADLGICTLQDSPRSDERKWEEGIAYLTSALEDAKCYIDQAPPDNRHMKNISYWYILLTLAIRGPELSTDLRELDDAVKKLRIADEFSIHTGVNPPKTACRLTQQTILKLYPVAVQEWNDVILRFSDPELRTSSSATIEDDLAAWLETMHMDDGVKEACHGGCAHPVINTNKVILYRCSWCENPSAILKKCSGCAKARYCDVTCQKAHWREHKMNCTNA